MVCFGIKTRYYTKWIKRGIIVLVRESWFAWLDASDATAAAIPITTGATADTAVHASFTGKVLFHNVFHGKLAATDYPKINVSCRTLFYLP